MQPRVLGIDDAPFERNKTKSVLIVGVLYRGYEFLEGLITAKIRQDGWDSTKRLIEAISGRFSNQIQGIFLNGISLGGFNIVDIEKLSRETKKPVIIIMRKQPDFNLIKNAMEKLPNPQKRWKLIEKAGPVNKTNKIFFQMAGIDKVRAIKLIEATTIRGNLPEALRVAHIIASGFVKGESRGGA